MPEFHLLQDLTIVMAAAAVMTLLCHILRQPVVLGYLAAGLIIGPYTPPFSLVKDLHSIQTMAELGLVVLMFVLGLEFSLPKLRKVGVRATLATVLEIFGMLAIGYAVGRWLGWSSNDSIYLGAILSISSTTIIIKVLTDLKLAKEEFAQAVFGILILEDIAAVVILTVLSGLGVRQESQSLTILRALGDVGFFVAIFLIIGLIAIPRLLRWVARFESEEMMGIVAFGLCLGSALLAKLFGFSTALGAFLMGAVIGVSPEVERIEKWIHPIRDLFSALFFVSAGLMIDPKMLWTIKGPVLLITVVTIVGKMLTGAAGSWLAGYPVKTASRIGMTLAQIGEFSFVFASLGVSTGLGSTFLYPLAVAVSALTTLFTPYAIRYSDPIVDGVLRWAPESFTHRLDRHHQKRSQQVTQSEHSRILSRYLWRLAIYVLVLAAGFLLTQAIDRNVRGHEASPWVSTLIWTLSWGLHLPLVHAIVKYINHFLLLVLTEFAMRPSIAPFFQKIPIQRTYDVLEGLTWFGLCFLWSAQPGSAGLDIRLILVLLVGLAGIAWCLKKILHLVYEKLEEILDEIFGLASSEPLRRAAIAIEGVDSILNDSIRRVMIGKRSPAVNQSLRDLRLREKTGVSVIGVYRDGSLNANPSPDTVIEQNDVLVVLGNPEECERTEQLLNKNPETSS